MGVYVLEIIELAIHYPHIVKEKKNYYKLNRIGSNLATPYEKAATQN